jgi:hypothetical protein
VDVGAMSARAGETAPIDQTLIDGILAEFDRIVGSR